MTAKNAAEFENELVASILRDHMSGTGSDRRKPSERIYDGYNDALGYYIDVIKADEPYQDDKHSRMFRLVFAEARKAADAKWAEAMQFLGL